MTPRTTIVTVQASTKHFQAKVANNFITMEDLSKVLAFEVKKELADRYFGFRKAIEEDSASYFEQILASAMELENKIGRNLVQIYTLLQNSDLILEFLRLTGLKEKLFFDDYVHITPQTMKKVFSCQLVKGLTRKGRIRNSLLDSYQALFEHIIHYREGIATLALQHETIREEINIFYQKNDLTGMMQFMRNLDMNQTDASFLDVSEGQSYEKMEKEMRLKVPAPVEELLPELPAIPEMKRIRKQLLTIADKSCKMHPAIDPRTFCQ